MIDEEFYKTLVSLRTSSTRDYHSLNSTYLTANILLGSLVSFLIFMGQNPNEGFNAMIIILSIFGIFLCFQMVFAQNRMRYINKLYEESMRRIEDTNQWTHRIFVDIENLVNNETRISYKKFPTNYTSISGYTSNLEKERLIGISNTWIGGRMKTFPWIFIILYSLALIYQLFLY